MKRVLVISLVAVLALCLSIVLLPAQPATAGGDFEVPSASYPTIQAGINAASLANGGTVLVAAGTYYENITLKDGVEVVSDRTGDTIISGSSDPPVVIAHSVNSSAKLDGFTITNGNASSHGGGITIEAGSDPIISNCVITGNSATFHGGGIAVHDGSSPTIINCTIADNGAGYYGGGIWVNQSSPIISNCLITGNTAGTYGGGILIYSSSPTTVTNCTLTGNSATNGGGIASLVSSSPTITNSIIYGNTATGNGPNIFNDETSTATVTYSFIEGGWSGDGNIGVAPDDDPLFVGSGDYHLQSDSPCIDTGDPDFSGPPDLDLDGNLRIADGDGDGDPVVDMGTYEAAAVIDTITIEIDIKPGSDPNSINPNSKGVTPVAILTTADFDAASVNVTTVSFGKEGTEAEPVHYSFEDVDDDGDTDMILHFKTQETGITAGDTEATLMGKTTDGKDIIGTDSVRTVPPKGKKGGK